jgi:phosphoribosyl-dephospho-CoA transferase
MKLSRHTLVWIKPQYSGDVVAQITEDVLRAQVAVWLAADRPLVVARQPMIHKDLADAGAGNAREPNFNRGHGPLLQDRFLVGNGIGETISVGLALPPAQGKLRIALGVSSNDIARHTLPLKLSDAIPHAPYEWQTALAELDAETMDIGIELRVFGSLAWQALSGLTYLTPQSDIDLLWHPNSRRQLQQGILLLARWEQSSGLRADGEVLFGGSSAVSWREWSALQSGDEQRVLVKRESSAELVDSLELLEMLA